MLDFSLLRAKKASLDQFCAGLTVADLHTLTDEMIDAMLGLLGDAMDADVTFQPVDPLANDDFAATAEEVNLAWMLGHVIVHVTATAEEGAARASTLARGVEITGRSRYEVPWQTVTTISDVRRRLEESRRMRHAFLDTWPDPPNLEMTYTAPYPNARPRNAVSIFVAGLAHDDMHLGQIADILSQARLARSDHE
jgi:hypothetical protein